MIVLNSLQRDTQKAEKAEGSGRRFAMKGRVLSLSREFCYILAKLASRKNCILRFYHDKFLRPLAVGRLEGGILPEVRGERTIRHLINYLALGFPSLTNSTQRIWARHEEQTPEDKKIKIPVEYIFSEGKIRDINELAFFGGLWFTFIVLRDLGKKGLYVNLLPFFCKSSIIELSPAVKDFVKKKEDEGALIPFGPVRACFGSDSRGDDKGEDVGFFLKAKVNKVKKAKEGEKNE